MSSHLVLIEWGDPSDARQPLVDAMTACWIAVTNAGGAVGFPAPPVDISDVQPATDALIDSLEPTRVRVILALIGDELAGWVAVVRNSAPVTAHWATVQRLQTLPTYQGRGIGRALMEHASAMARDTMGVEQLWLSVRGGMGLEDFYRGLGWREIGRHPGALRIAPGDDRDEIYLVLDHL